MNYLKELRQVVQVGVEANPRKEGSNHGPVDGDVIEDVERYDRQRYQLPLHVEEDAKQGDT